MKHNLVEALIGALVLVLAGGFFVFTYSRTDVGTIEGYELTARFDRVDGLLVGSDVRLGGIRVGSVIRQAIDLETFEAVIHFSVRSDLRLPSDTSASITTEGLLGGAYLSLTPGGDIEYLVAGEQIEFTQGSIDLFGLLGKAVFSVADKNGDKE